MSRPFRIVPWWLVVVVLIGPPTTLAAQRPGPDKRLERALLIEKSEHDLGAAEVIYREVIEDRASTAATKTRARLLLGLCLLDQGKEDEGKGFLEAAAGGEGVHAEKARSVLDGRAAAKRRLETTVTELIDGGGPNMVESLVEIGDPAVPYLIEALKSSNDHYRSQTFADILVRIASGQVVAFAESVVRAGDVYLERLFLQRMSHLAGVRKYDASPFGNVLRAFLPLVRTGERKTRREIVRLASGVVTTEELLGLLSHPDEYVRNRALSEIERRDLLDDAKIMARVGPMVESFLGTDKGSEANILENFLENGDVLATHQGKDLVLAALRGRVTVSSGRSMVWRKGLIASIEKGHFLAARDLAELCQTLGPTSGVLDQVITELIESSAGYWNADAVGDVLTMMRSGYGAKSGPTLQWFLGTATDAHYTLIAGDLDRYGDDTLSYILHWMANHTATDPALPALERAVGNPEGRRRLAATKPRETGSARRRRSSDDDALNGLELVVNAITSIGTGAAADALLRLVRIAPLELEEPVVERLVAGPPSFDRALLPLLDVVSSEESRESVLTRLAERGIYDREAIQGALEKGVAAEDYFERIITGSPDQRENELCLYDRTTVVEILHGVIAGTSPENWRHLYFALDGLFEHREGQIPRPVVELLFDRALANPDPWSRSALVSALFGLSDEYAAAKRDLYRRAVASDDEKAFWVAIETDLATPEDLSRLRPFLKEDSRLAQRAIGRLVSLRDPQYIPWIAEALENPSFDVRGLALEQIYRLGGDDSLELILPLRSDPISSVRTRLYDLLGRSAAPEAAEALLEGLRDEDEGTRKVAQASLEKIEQYYEHRRRWERLKDALSVEGGSAEEALVRLAREGSSKKVRVAAIRSLGTLAVLDTLPFLIVLMEDPDAEIAAAAEEAVNRINTKGVKEPSSSRE